MALLWLALPAWAQQRTIRGRVVDQNGQPVASVLVNVKGTNRAVSTGEDGTYQIEAKKGDVLAFSLIGFDKASVTVGDRAEVNLTMRESEAFKMSDVVVVGYSKVERRDLTGSVSSVKPKDDIGFQTVDQMLQGAAPGVYMSNSSGALGGANVLTIRGISSIMGDNNPLYVIDGVPVCIAPTATTIPSATRAVPCRGRPSAATRWVADLWTITMI